MSDSKQRAAILGVVALAGAAYMLHRSVRRRAVRLVHAAETKVSPILVSVCGGSGSGKSTVVEHLIRDLNTAGYEVTVVGQDCYYKDLAHKSLDERARTNFDHPDSIDFDLFFSQLADLQRGKSVLRPSYDFATHTRCAPSACVTLTPAHVIIIDGILSLHNESMRQLYDISVFVSVDEETRLARRTARDVKERGRDVEGVHRQFRETVAPMHQTYVEPTKKHADIELPWGHDHGHTEKGRHQVERDVSARVIQLLSTRSVAPSSANRK